VDGSYQRVYVGGVLNWFMVAGAILMAGASITEILRGNWLLAAVYVSYCVANIMLSMMGGK